MFQPVICFSVDSTPCSRAVEHRLWRFRPSICSTCACNSCQHHHGNTHSAKNKKQKQTQVWQLSHEIHERRKATSLKQKTRAKLTACFSFLSCFVTHKEKKTTLTTTSNLIWTHKLKTTVNLRINSILGYRYIQYRWFLQ